MYAPFMTVYLVLSLPKTPYTIHRVYKVLANLICIIYTGVAGPRCGHSCSPLQSGLCNDILTVRTVNLTVITVQNGSGGVIAQP